MTRAGRSNHARRPTRRLAQTWMVVVPAMIVVLAATYGLGRMGDATPAQAAPTRVPPLATFGVWISATHCYRPDALVPVRVSGVAPNTVVRVTPQDGVLVAKKADGRGRASIRFVAPPGLPHGSVLSAQVVEVVATTSIGLAGRTFAYVFGTPRACAALARAAT